MKDFARWPMLVAGVVAGLVWSILAWATASKANWEQVNTLTVWPTWPMFMDLRCIWEGCEAWSHGVDPLREDSALFNYPRTWLILSNLGIHHLALAPAALALDALFLVGVVAWIRPATWWPALLTAVLLVSPPIRFATERGNVDMILWTISACAACAYGRKPHAVAVFWVTPTLLLLGTVLKLYPLAALLLGGFLAPDPPARRRWFIATAVAAVFIGSQWQEIVEIGRKTPQAIRASYGVTVFGERAYDFFHEVGSRAASGANGWIRLVSTAVYALGVALVFLRAVRQRRFTREAEPERSWAGFWIGSAVYVGSFALGANFNYRLIFLLLPVPQLVALSSSSGRLRKWAITTLIVLALVMIAPSIPSGAIFAALELCRWLLAMLLVFGVVVLTPSLYLPDWLRANHAHSQPARA